MNTTRCIALLVACYLLLAALRLTAPFDLDNRDQAKQGLYVLDVVQRGAIFLPTERGEKPASKPPLYNWAAALVSLAWGDVTDVTIRVPALVCGLGVALLTLQIGAMLLSRQAGLLAALMLLCSNHFALLAGIARTDMMLCFFIVLSLYLFLLAYQRRGEKTVYPLLMFVSLGFGSITKGPVVLLALLVAVVYLALRRDLRALKSMSLGLGIVVWLAMLLAWFIPALLEGGEAFRQTMLNETVNRVFATGARAGKARPLYYFFFFSIFFLQFLPWSLFVPFALARFWKAKPSEEKHRLLFAVTWLLTVFVFFSLVRGKRSDYILPLYPAACLLVAHFWTSALAAQDASRRTRSARIVSMASLTACLLMVAVLAALMVAPSLPESLSRMGPDLLEKIGRLRETLQEQRALFLAIAVPLAIAAAAGLVAAKRRPGRTLGLLLVASALNLALGFHILLPRALTRAGADKRAFCARVADRIGPADRLAFCHVGNSVLFYLKRNVPLVDHPHAVAFLQATETSYLVTMGKDQRALQALAGFELVAIEQSPHLAGEDDRLVLVTKR